MNQDVNNPLWTLPYELWCYVALALMFVFGVRRSAVFIVVVALLLGTAWSASSLIGEIDIGPLEAFEFFRLRIVFRVRRRAGGRLAVDRQARDRDRSGRADRLLAVRNLLAIDTVLNSLPLAAAVVRPRQLQPDGVVFERGDASYGMYVFAWPVQQFVLLLVAPFWLSLRWRFSSRPRSATRLGMRSKSV